jgi:vitamin B12 transporter
MLKKLIGFLLYGFCLFPVNAVTELPDTIHLNEVIVTGRKAPAVYSELSRIVTVIERNEIERMPVQSLSGILEYIVSADVRERGALGVQSDLSIRGGSFEQVLLLLNGIKMNDPQTGHHHLNIPMDLQNIERIEILEGPGSRIFGPYAYAGAINIITKSSMENSIGFSVTGGQYSYLNASLSLDFMTGPVKNTFSVNRKNSDGYIENTDFVIHNLFYNASFSSRKLDTEIQAGYLQKAFGANSFYTPLYPEQFEEVNTSFFSFKNTLGERSKLSHNIYYRRHNDRFELFRYEPAAWYNGHNYHQTDVYGTEFLYTIPWSLGISALGLESRTEKILSNVLGEPMRDTIWLNMNSNAFYSKFKRRDHVSFFGEHNFYWNKTNLSLGLLGNFNRDFGWNVFPGMDLSYELIKEVKLFLSYNQSLRMPSFTELYYAGPTNTGNPDLKPEIANNYEAGIKFSSKGITGHLQAFYREGKNIIDWVRIADSLKWASLNLTELSTMGFDVRFEMRFEPFTEMLIPLEKLSFGYSYIDVTKQSGDYASVYALDQLRHKFTMVLQHKFPLGLKALWHLNYQNRAGTYTQFPSGNEVPYKDFMVMDVKFLYQFNQVNIFAEFSNIWNINYIDFGNIKQPGRWIKFGVSSRINVK